ncbi:MAG: bifunctional shikimate kinase/3-dehydroquinate synthase [Deltaproteobacteria bacterium]|nr:bifunctional shikimate kinase/3-dehydroquinate synthase [Deltaproteobacteria bacterium]
MLFPGKNPRPKAPPKEGALPPELGRHLFLIGFMGSGKTSVGRALAKLLGREFLDLDKALEREYGMPIPAVFKDPSLGEPDFREREAKRISGLLTAKGAPKVVALGGGATMDPKTREALKANGLVFYLRTDDPGLLWERVSREAKGGDPASLRPLALDFKAFGKLFKDRLPSYQGLGLPLELTSPPETIAASIGSTLVARVGDFSAYGESRCSIRTFLTKDGLFSKIADATSGHKCLVLLDHALPFEEGALLRALGPDRAVVYRTKARGEAAKNLRELEGLLSALADGPFDRSDFLVARGGGSLTDLGALAAGLFKRGIRLILSPTTLLGAVDAAIGGKAAVNFGGAKNQLGIFYLPQDVWLDGETLGSLPQALLSEGLTEAYKMGLLSDKGLSETISSHLGALLRIPKARPGPESPRWEGLDPLEQHPTNDVPLLTGIAFRSATLKMEVVAADFRENLGIRDRLNLGHTWGHVVEGAHAGGTDAVSHGRAVAHGMAVSLLYSERALGLPHRFAHQARSVCLTLAGGTFPENPEDDVAKALLLKDKKIRDGALKFVGLRNPEDPVLLKISPEELIGVAKDLAIECSSKALRPYL